MLKVNSINRGIVIDHIPVGKGIKIFDKLKLNEADFPVVLLMNVSSNISGKKDIIKIENVMDIDLTLLGLIDSNITVNIIDDNKIIEKKKVEIPKKVTGMFKCKNSRCISNFDDYVSPKFKLVHKNSKLLYSCEYCDELTTYVL